MTENNKALLDGEDLEGQQTLDIKGQPTKRKRRKRPPLTAEEKEQLAEMMQTERHKGAMMKRINMPLTPSNHEYLTELHNNSGVSITKIVNAIIEVYREDKRPEIEDNKAALDIVANKYKYGAAVYGITPGEPQKRFSEMVRGPEDQDNEGK